MPTTACDSLGKWTILLADPLDSFRKEGIAGIDLTIAGGVLYLPTTAYDSLGKRNMLLADPLDSFRKEGIPGIGLTIAGGIP